MQDYIENIKDIKQKLFQMKILLNMIKQDMENNSKEDNKNNVS